MKNIYKNLNIVFGSIVLLLALSVPSSVWAHCQIPCGIYDDNMRVKLMLEDSETVIKAVKMIAEFEGKSDAQSVNQQVRWVMNKEKHAQNIIESISDYFLTQRVKSSQKDYTERLKKHHAVIVAAMKAKQSAGKDAAMNLKKAVEALEGYYPPHTH